MPELDDFAGQWPYASELYGVYQPLLGWRSLRSQQRADAERAHLADEILGGMLVDPRFQRAGEDGLMVGPRGAGPRPVPGLFRTEVGRTVQLEAQTLFERRSRLPNAAEWRRMTSPARLNPIIREIRNREQIGRRAEPSECGEVAPGVRVFKRGTLTNAEAKTMNAAPVAGTDFLIASSPATTVATHREALAAGAMQYLAANTPSVLNALLISAKKPWEIGLSFVDPLADFDPASVEAVLSPVGLIHLFREYFFELENFLGPPVGHVWISPGGTVELAEVSTRRTVTERLNEIFSETTIRSERTVTEQEELSDAVKQENQRDIKLGVSASGGVNLGVFHAEASATFGIDTTHRQAQEVVHKRMRQQSERLSSEIRRNFKTTFRTVNETTDSSSRKYVVQNTTDQLVNYELRRKMRRVAVQTHHIGARMCWQVFVDEPGSSLKIAELAHLAQRQDLEGSVPPPEAPAQLEPKQTDYQVDVPFRALNRHDNRDDLYIDGFEDGDQLEDHIQHVWEFEAPPPAQGYELAFVNPLSIDRADPEENLPNPVAAEYAITGVTRFRITLNQVNFNDQPSIRFLLQLLWNPPDQTAAQTEYRQKLAEYDNEKQRTAQEEYAEAARERIEKYGNIRARPTDDLREEERNVVYRRLIAQLMEVGGEATPHIASELIRSLFDIDQMLYFVAPDWWRARRRILPNNNATTTTGPVLLTNDNQVGWDGPLAQGRDTYLVTENSEPVRLGSSLGWLQQPDGDDLRNAFLNSPWVKAVLPIRPGRERAAINWLIQAHVESADGLGAQYGGPEPNLQGLTLGEALDALADEIKNENTGIQNALASEKVFESGFDPLAGAFIGTGTPYEVFSQWVEVLPTDQVVALQYDAAAHV